MRVRVHRGTQEVGGSCVEVEADDGRRIVLDLGRPLSAGWDDEVELPDVSGLRDPDDSLLGVFITHPHPDHFGLVESIETDVPIHMGQEAARLLDAAAFFSPASASIPCAGHLVHRRPIACGPFVVTPMLADHSGYDSYSLLVEADGQRLFYTGDLRGHGRKASLFEQLLDDPPIDVDVLLMEGTHVRADPVHDSAVPESEADLEQRFVGLCDSTDGVVVVLASAQNLDRLVTVYRAAVRSGRTLVVDLYAATVAAATRATIPQPGHDHLRVYVPNRQRIRVKQTEEFERVERIRRHRIFPEALAAEPQRHVLYVPSSTVPELLRAGALTSSGVAVWSMWSGYLDESSGVRLRAQLDEAGVGLTHLHTSGHASVGDLKRLVAAISPGRVVPIHSDAGDRYAELFPDVDPQVDGVWWDVAGTA